jgi:hypothetical protein
MEPFLCNTQKYIAWRTLFSSTIYLSLCGGDLYRVTKALNREWKLGLGDQSAAESTCLRSGCRVNQEQEQSSQPTRQLDGLTHLLQAIKSETAANGSSSSKSSRMTQVNE